jgi:ABC-type molybdate transport system substrate-binding protein
MIKYELNIKNIEQFNKMIESLSSNSILHLTDKKNNLDIKELLRINNNIKSITFSIKNHYNEGKIDLINEELDEYIRAYKLYNLDELLLVSGSNKGKYTTVELLEYLKNKDVSIGVAYNCNIIDQEVENERLTKKLSYDFVKSVYIQITDDIEKIKLAIHYIRSIRNNLSIYVCVVNPSNSFINNFKLRPWNGVILSKISLSSIDQYALMNKKIIESIDDPTINYIFTL